MCLFLDQPNTTFPSKLVDSGNHAFNILRAHKKKTALNISDSENVARLNSLQVIHASRFLYVESDSFQIARRMIADNEKFRERGREMSFDQDDRNIIFARQHERCYCAKIMLVVVLG